MSGFKLQFYFIIVVLVGILEIETLRAQIVSNTITVGIEPTGIA